MLCEFLEFKVSLFLYMTSKPIGLTRCSGEVVWPRALVIGPKIGRDVGLVIGLYIGGNQ